MKINKVIISGGGTGGHIFPAISIANEIKRRNSAVDILFVGAQGRMEMEKVPAAGYAIEGLPISGFHRKFSLHNLTLIFKLIGSLAKAYKIIGKFKPDVVVGVGGYASGPLLYMAALRGVPTVIQEQNSYAGITNKLLGKKAKSICVAYENMGNYFPSEKIVLTGNPIRKDLIKIHASKEQAAAHFGFDEGKQVLLIIGGSLGARTLNQSVLASLDLLAEQQNIVVLWQTGKYYHANMLKEMSTYKAENIKVLEFISRMDLAYTAADIIVSRAGAGTISELCLVGKPVILVPSPNVAEDHQTKNAEALASQKAAIMLADKDAQEELIKKAIHLMDDNIMKQKLSENIHAMAITDSAERIVSEIELVVETSK